jgi:hypothetical protein
MSKLITGLGVVCDHCVSEAFDVVGFSLRRGMFTTSQKRGHAQAPTVK